MVAPCLHAHFPALNLKLLFTIVLACLRPQPAEFCDGGTLKTAIDDGRLHDVSGDGSPRPVMSCILQLAVDIAAGMAHVHSRNIVHGDLVGAGGGVSVAAVLCCC
jgi:hypothetical protein